MGKASPPPAPNPAKIAAAQGAANKETAIAQYQLDATNQYTPYGNLEYTQNGYWDAANTVPRFSVKQTPSAAQQGLIDSGQQAQTNLSNIAVDQSGKLQGLLNSPVSLNNEATEARINELGRSRLDPMFNERRQQLDSQLLARGVGPGTEAYDREVMNFERSRNDAYNELALKGRGQSVQEILAQRNQPINEITALMSGSQVSQPNFINAPAPGVAPTDVAGIHQNAYNAQMAQYNAQNAGNNGMMSGLFGLGSKALGGLFG